MGLTLLREGKILSPQTDRELFLGDFCTQNDLNLTLEWLRGQYWLHSDIPKELPIGLSLDSELKRHEEYFRKSSLQKELLARSIGVKGPYRPHVLDLSAGLLGDTLLFLSFGCRVIAVERHPVIAFLIQSALENAQHPVLQNLTFHPTESLSFLDQCPEVDVIYFDPMFEDANHKSSPRKEMRIFRSLVGPDMDSLTVFEKARALGRKRLVVKRPRLSKSLAPTILQYTGKATRYDVYLS